MKTKFVLLILLTIIIGCSPKIRSSISNSNFTHLDESAEIIILDSAVLPENSQYIGDLKIGDTGFSTDCSYNKVMSDAKAEARKVGGNLIQIIELKEPSTWGSTCYRIKAKIYRNMDTQLLMPLKEDYVNRNRSRLPVDANYASVYIYRPKMMVGSAIGYKVRMDNDSVVCRTRSGEKCEVRITDFGKHTFWAKTESADSLTIDIQKGQEYFIRCAMGIGVFIGRPDLNLVENHVAMKEFEEMEE